MLPPRPDASHKGDYGHVLVLGGSTGKAGAVRLAGEATFSGDAVFTISSGGSGGVFAPSLVIGGVTGAVFAAAADREVNKYLVFAAASAALIVASAMGVLAAWVYSLTLLPALAHYLVKPQAAEADPAPAAA